MSFVVLSSVVSPSAPEAELHAHSHRDESAKHNDTWWFAMIKAVQTDGDVRIDLTKSQAIVLFEWLSRNWEVGCLQGEDSFADPSEKQVLMWLEGALQRTLSEPFDAQYHRILNSAKREVVPDPSEWDDET